MLEELKEKVASIGNDIQSIIQNTKNAVDSDISPEKLAEINNIVRELEKASINLGNTVSK